MSSSRVVRGTKGRIIFCVCAIFVVVAVIACYNNTLSQLDEVRKTSDQCHQQQENLSTQLQVIFDYKQRLEKSLKTEKAEHQQTKKVLETKIEEEHTKNENAANEANLKLSSLQQHYNLLKTQHDDFKEECSKTQQQQLDEINILQAKLKEVQGQFKKSIIEKENSFEHLKSQYMQLQVDRENLEKQLKDGQNKDIQVDSNINHLTKVNHELQRELNNLKAKCSIHLKAEGLTPGPQNQISPPANVSNVNDDAKKLLEKQEPGNVADLPSNVEDDHAAANEQLAAPKTEKIMKDNNSNVLASPNNVNILPPNQKPSSTVKSSLAVAQPLHIPSITVSSSINNKPSEGAQLLPQDQHVLPVPHVNKIPVGVVPAPESHLETMDKDKSVNKHNGDEKEIREDVNNAFPNRYRNNLIQNEMANEAKAKEADKQRKIEEEHKGKPVKVDTGDADNAAVEEIDPPNNNNNNNLDPFGLDDPHDRDKVNIKRSQPKLLKHISGLGDEPMKSGKQGHKAYDGGEGIDYDKDVQNGLAAEENDPEAEDDDPDYADPGAHQKDVAVRN